MPGLTRNRPSMAQGGSQRQMESMNGGGGGSDPGPGLTERLDQHYNDPGNPQGNPNSPNGTPAQGGSPLKTHGLPSAAAASTRKMDMALRRKWVVPAVLVAAGLVFAAVHLSNRTKPAPTGRSGPVSLPGGDEEAQTSGRDVVLEDWPAESPQVGSGAPTSGVFVHSVPLISDEEEEDEGGVYTFDTHGGGSGAYEWAVPEGAPTPDPALLENVEVTTDPDDGSPVSLKWNLPSGSPTPNPALLDQVRPRPVEVGGTDPSPPLGGQPAQQPTERPAEGGQTMQVNVAPDDGSKVGLTWGFPAGSPTPPPALLENVEVTTDEDGSPVSLSWSFPAGSPTPPPEVLDAVTVTEPARVVELAQGPPTSPPDDEGATVNLGWALPGAEPTTTPPPDEGATVNLGWGLPGDELTTTPPPDEGAAVNLGWGLPGSEPAEQEPGAESEPEGETEEERPVEVAPRPPAELEPEPQPEPQPEPLPEPEPEQPAQPQPQPEPEQPAQPQEPQQPQQPQQPVVVTRPVTAGQVSYGGGGGGIAPSYPVAGATGYGGYGGGGAYPVGIGGAFPMGGGGGMYGLYAGGGPCNGRPRCQGGGCGCYKQPEPWQPHYCFWPYYGWRDPAWRPPPDGPQSTPQQCEAAQQILWEMQGGYTQTMEQPTGPIHNAEFIGDCWSRECAYDENPDYFGGQSHEDEAIYEIFYTNPIKCCGVVVEVGAGDGIKNSASLWFERAMGWKSILYEADPVKFKELEKNRPDAKKVNGAFCQAGMKSVLHDSRMQNPNSQFGTFVAEPPGAVVSERLAVGRETNPDTSTQVPCVTMGSYLDNLGVTRVDVMIVRTGGDPLSVIMNGFNWRLRVDIWVILMDNDPDTSRDADGNAVKTRDDKMRQTLTDNLYVKAEWDIKRWCGSEPGTCLPHEVFLRKGFNPLPDLVEDGPNRRRLLEIVRAGGDESAEGGAEGGRRRLRGRTE